MKRIVRYVTAIILLSICICRTADAAQAFPSANGDRAKYNMKIEFSKAYISGIMVLLNENGDIRASIVNEFGVSAMDFVYLREKDRIRIESILKKIDKWYIKAVLRKDLRNVLKALENGESSYVNNKQKITYTFSSL